MQGTGGSAGRQSQWPPPPPRDRLRRGWSAELAASLVGLAVCLTFLLMGKGQLAPVPIVLGMAVTCLTVPLLLGLAPSCYRRHRTGVLLLVRLTLMQGTTHDFQEARRGGGEQSWPSLLLTLLYSSRTPVIAGWGALGFQLPLRMHIAAQLAHVALAGWRLAPGVCRAGGPLMATSDKLQSLALALDWPLRVVGGAPLLMPPVAACLALVAWTQFAGAFVLPTALLWWRQRQQALQPAATAAGDEDEWSIPHLSIFAAQLGWLALRTALQPSTD